MKLITYLVLIAFEMMIYVYLLPLKDENHDTCISINLKIKF